MKKLNKIFRTSEIAGIDQYTIENEPVSSLDLMERASRAWTKYFQEKFANDREMAVVAGSGNNGGDGFAIARLLREQGWKVMVFRLVTGGKMSIDCETNYRRFLECGGVVTDVSDIGDFKPEYGCMLVDAIFGSGLNRKITGLAAEVIRKMNALGQRVVAVDIPSGLMGEDNSDNDPSVIVEADYTFTFQFPKLAFMLAENDRYVGEWSVLDIGLHPAVIADQPTSYYYMQFEDVADRLPRQQKFAHKGTNGRGLLVAGGYGMMGAAVLAAKAAVRSGVGLLYCHVPVAEKNVIHIAVPEALIDLDQSDGRFSGIHHTEKYDAVAIGPAIGKGPEMVEGVKQLLTDWKGTTIIDADALNILSEHRELLSLLHEGCILTPHVKEFERLTGKCRNDFERLNKLSTFASQYKVCVILKGAHTAIASAEGEICFNMSGNPGMAKGGAGDVLTGVLLGLAANGLPPLEVALVGVFAHGLSGDIAAKEWGMRGICAGILAEGMGKAWKKLENKV
ncbi:MAG: NAD(P)H-hydrate dehydratase [Odoribacter splanchnicus]|nr:NAD(P)H-hydrate dehydratase [Odoribacter splanchnicus]